MQLTLPACTAAIEGKTGKIDPRAVLLFQLEPLGIAFIGGQIRVLVHDVLELVHFASVSKEHKTVLSVEQGVFVGIPAEEQMMPRCSQELHGHGVDLGALHAGAFQIGGHFGITLGHIALKGVAALVGQHVHIAGGVVPVGKNEGGLVAGQAGHIAAGHLAGAALHIEQLVVLHKVDELGGFRAKLMVHGAGGIHTGFVAGNGLGIAVLEHDGQIGEGGAGNAGALCTHGHHLLQLGHHIVCHLIAEFPDLFRAVADAVHAHIGKLTVVVIAHHPGLCIQVLHDLAVQLVQLGTVGVKITGLGLVGGAAHGRVQILLVRAQLRDGELFAVQFHQCAAVDLLVAAHQSIELLLQLHGAVIHAQNGILHTGHTGGAEFFGQGIHMRVRKESAADLYAGVGHGGAVGIKEVLLSLPVFIAGVAGVVDVGKVRGGVVLCKGFALLIIEPDKGIAVRCGSGLCGQLFAPGQQGTDVRAGIGHFVEFHWETFLSGRRLHI